MIDTSARLISIEFVGELGSAQRVETATPILCEISSVNRTEFFQAYNSGFRPEWRVTTAPINYSGQRLVDLYTPEGTVRCDVYRTFRKSHDVLELWCCRQNPDAVQIFTLWTANKRVVLHGAYLTGSDGAERVPTGKIATDTVTLVLPQTLQAFVGEQPVAYCRPKAYANMNTADQEKHFFIDTTCFFALGDIDPTLPDIEVPGVGIKYQQLNALYDDVWRVQSVNRRNRGKIDTEYIEVVGK